MTDAIEAEFDGVAQWTRQAVRQAGEDYALPAACQGSASPDALDWLARACPDRRLLDVGGGTGGPAAYAADRFGALPLLVDPMPGACSTARDLFGLPAVAGSGEALPVATGAFRAVWCLGVLCTTSQRPAFLAELRPVLADGGDLACWCSNGTPRGCPTRPRAMTSPPRPSSTGRCATRGSSSWTGFRTMSCRPRRARGASGPIACKL